MRAFKRIIRAVLTSTVGILLVGMVGQAQVATSADGGIAPDPKHIEQYLDVLIARATIAADAANIIKEADSYRSRAKEKVKVGRQDEARRLLRQAGELIAAGPRW